MKRYWAIAFVTALAANAATAATSVLTLSPTRSATSGDLLETAVASRSSSGTFNNFGSAGIGALTNGVALYSNTDDGSPNYNTDRDTDGAVISSGAVLTYGLATNTAATVNGYDISEILIWHGWIDGGRDEGRVTVEYATVADPGAFIEIVNATAANFQPSWNYGRMRLIDGSGVSLATNACKIRFTFPSQENGSVGYSELDVVGGIASDVEITPSGGSTAVTEGGPGTDTYTIHLSSAPAANVTVTVATDGEVTVSPSVLTFTPGDYAVAQTCTVTVVDDDDIEQTHYSALQHSVSSTDPAYDGVNPRDLTVTVSDNDVPGVTTDTSDAVVNCSAVDLLQVSLDTVQSISGIGGGGESVLRNGEALYDRDSTATPSYESSTEYGYVGNDATATYLLDLSSGTLGYSVTQIDVYHGWPDDGRDRCRVTVEYSFVDAPETFHTFITAATYDPPSNYGRTRLTPASGTYFAEGVARLRFTFPSQENSAVGYAELDVFGAATVGHLGTIVLFR